MHTVTKFLIVICAVLSLVLAALSIAYTANANALRSAYKSEQSQRIAAQSAVNSEFTQGAQERSAQAIRIQGLESDLAARANEVANLQKERTGLRTDLERARTDTDAIKNQIGQLGATTDTQAALIKNYREEVTALRDGLLGAQKREIELVDRVNELESVREVLQQNARALKEQLEETKLALQTAQQNQASGGATTLAARALESTPRELAGSLVRARIDDVFTSPAGDAMVVISEGGNRGIKDNALMHIVRGDQFVGSIVITAVEPGRSVGRINTYGRSISAQAGDIVLSRLN